MWMRRSRSTGLATEKVEFVTKQRKGWCFLSFFFLVLHSALLFWIPAGSLAAALSPLSAAKIFGHIPLSYTLLHKIKLRDEKRHNLKRQGGKGPVNQTAAQVTEEKDTAWVKVLKRLSSGIKGNEKKKFTKKVEIEEACFRIRIFFSANMLSSKCELQNDSSPLPQHSSRSLSKALPRSERGREKAATFSLSPKWLRAGGKRLRAERKSGVLRPAQGRAGRFSEHLSPRFPCPHA